MRREHALSSILAVALLMAPAQAFQQKSTLAVELQSAIQRETVQGDIRGALKQYERILSRAGKSDRETAARTLLRIGQCHEKLGSAEARKAYERLVRDFGDQKDAAEAKSRLALLNPSAPPAGERVVHAADFIRDARPSRTGKFVSFLCEGAICILDTATEAVKVAVAAPASREARHWRPLVSPDGSLVAYTHFANERAEGKGDLHVSRTDRSGDRTLIAGSATDHDYFSAVDWTADGSQILVAKTNDHKRGLVIVPAAGGAVKELDTPDFNWWTGRRISKFSPDGQWIAYPSATPEQSTRGFVPTDVRVMAAGGGQSSVVMSGPGHDYVLGWLNSGELVTVSERSGKSRAYRVQLAAGKVSGEPILLDLAMAEPVQDESVIGVSLDGAVFVNEQGMQSEFYTFRPGNEGLQKFQMGFQTTRLAMSPDGSKLAYATGGIGSQDSAIVIRDMASGNEKMLPTRIPPVLKLTWFPDGKAVLAISNTGNYGRRPTFRIQVESGEVKPAAEVVEMTSFYTPAILNDGRTLVYTGRKRSGDGYENIGEIVALDLETGAMRALVTPQPGRSIGSGALSADRTKIVYTETSASPRGNWLMISSLDNPQPKVVCQGANCLAAVPYFAPGDREIVFWKANQNGVPADHLWRVSAEGGEPQLFRETKWTMAGPVFHPTSGEVILGVDRYSARLVMKGLRQAPR